MTEHSNLAGALVAALADLSVVDKGRTAKIDMKGGGSYEYEYADLGDVVKLTRPKLAEHGIVVLTPVEEHGTGLKCTIVLLHSSGERLDFGPFPFPHGQTAQATGSMVTYYRRYALVAALGMAAGDDDDGAQAQPRQERRDEVACRTCGAMVPGALSDKEPMRVHMIDLHEWVRNDDGTVAPPKIVDSGTTDPTTTPAGSDDATPQRDAPDPAGPLAYLLDKIGIAQSTPEMEAVDRWAETADTDTVTVLEQLDRGELRFHYGSDGTVTIEDDRTPAERNTATRKQAERAGAAGARRALEAAK